MLDTSAFTAADRLARVFEGTAMRPHEGFRGLIEVLFCVTLATVPEYQCESLAKEFEEAMRPFDRCRMPREQVLTMAKDLIEAMAANGGDRLGDMAARLNLLSAGMGQFFTPSCVATLLARMTMPDADMIRRAVETDGYFGAMDPAAGSGGLLISLAQRVRECGYDPRFHMFAEPTEKDVEAWRMCYVQLSAYDIPARVVLGDSLTLERRRVAYTPAYFRYFKPRRGLDALLRPGPLPSPMKVPADEEGAYP